MQRRNKTGKRTQSKCRTYEEQAGSANTWAATTFRQFSSECRWNSGGAAGGASGSSLKSRPHPPSFSSLPSVVTWRPAKQVYILEHDKVARPDTASSLCVSMYLCPCIYMHVCIQSRGRGASACVNVSCSVPVMASLQTDRVYSFSRILSFSLCVSLSRCVRVCVCLYVCIYTFLFL